MTDAIAAIDVELRTKYAAEDVERELADIRATCADLDPSAGAEAYEASRVAIGKLRATRTAIERRRVELKAESLETGRRIDATAKVLTAMIEEIEEPLRNKKKAVDEAEQRAKFEREHAERLVREAAERAAREAEDQRRRDELAAEESRLAEQRRLDGIENDRIMREQAEREAAQRKENARLKAERDAIAEERRKLDEEKARAARAEAERLAAIQSEAAAKAAAARAEEERQKREEADRAAAEAAKVAAAAQAEVVRVRLELAPDVDCVRVFAARITSLANITSEELPLRPEEAREEIEEVCQQLGELAVRLEDFANQSERKAS